MEEYIALITFMLGIVLKNTVDIAVLKKDYINHIKIYHKKV